MDHIEMAAGDANMYNVYRFYYTYMLINTVSCYSFQS